MLLEDDTPEDYVPPAKVSTWVSNLNDLNTIHLKGDSVIVGQDGSVGSKLFELTPMVHYGPPMWTPLP